MKKSIIVLTIIALSGLSVVAQEIGASVDYVRSLTSQWTGERFKDGRPKVSDLVLQKLESATLEQVWGYMMKKGYTNQVEMDWIVLKPGEVMTGRVVTAQFMPTRPDLDSLVRAQGKLEGRSQKGGINTWPIDVLDMNDIYVADGYGKIKDGTLIGSSLGNSIYGKTGKGVIFYGSIRDMQELKETDGFNAWIKGHHPSYIRDMTPTSINAPIRIGDVTVFPGDVVFANEFGVAFIPAHMVNDLVLESEMVGLNDEFERYLLQQNKYPTGLIHGEWNDAIEKEFRAWFAKYPKPLTVTKSDIDAFLKKRMQ